MFSMAANHSDHCEWQEGSVSVRPKRDSRNEDRATLSEICQVLQMASRYGNLHLRLLVEHCDRDSKLWQLRSKPKQSYFLEHVPEVSLHTLLSATPHYPPAAKRKMAIIFANTILQLHESSWLRERWNKGHITFFYKSVDEPDLSHPYLSALFDDGCVSDAEVPDMNRFHRSPSILTLGILLIEVHTGRPIEFFRMPRDLTNGRKVNVNTDWTTAGRVVNLLDDCSGAYRGAIKACLDTPWVPSGQRISLEDADTRNDFINDVLQPLKDELAFIKKEKM